MLTSVRKLFVREASRPEGLEQMKVIRSRKEMLRSITIARDSQCVLGIYSPALGDGMFFTGVLSIVDEHGEVIINFSQYDMNGVLLMRTELALSEIKSVCLFPFKYENPLIKAGNETFQ